MELKRNSLTLNADVIGQGIIERVNTLLQGKCEWLSRDSNAVISNKAAAGYAIGTLCIVAGILLMEDSVAEYGWGAFCLLLGILFSKRLFKEFLETVKD